MGKADTRGHRRQQTFGDHGYATPPLPIIHQRGVGVGHAQVAMKVGELTTPGNEPVVFDEVEVIVEERQAPLDAVKRVVYVGDILQYVLEPVPEPKPDLLGL